MFNTFLSDELPVDIAYDLAAGWLVYGRARHQVDVSGSAGSVDVSVDFGTGFRTVHTIDLSDTARLPFAFEAAIKGLRLTSTVAETFAYHAEGVA